MGGLYYLFGALLIPFIARIARCVFLANNLAVWQEKVGEHIQVGLDEDHKVLTAVFPVFPFFISDLAPSI